MDTLRSHLTDVARRAAEFASTFNAAPEAHLIGLIHDLGKYGDLFERRLEGLERGLDHWSAGAWMALRRYEIQGVAAAMAIQGHHVGLIQSYKEALRKMNYEELQDTHPLGLRLTSKTLEPLLDRFHQDGLVLPDKETIEHSIYAGTKGPHASAMLDIRMLFSALVDADFVETEAHFQGNTEGKKYRSMGLTLKPAACLKGLDRHITALAEKSEASPSVHGLRQDLLTACRDAAELEPGLFTLTAPTGAGKTLAMLAFALKHAWRHHRRRIICVIPYLTIIEQTARAYRQALNAMFTPEEIDRYILEHHSLAGIRGRDAGRVEEEADLEDEVRRRIKLLAENWDAPIVVTTSVQFLESLFANRPAACRKLHRLAESVILFDEVQTLPAALAVPTLATLSRLTERYGATVVFSTATQPAFGHLNEEIEKFCAGGWRPREIAPARLRLFERARRTRTVWPKNGVVLSWPEVADRLLACGSDQVLCIVNLKRHAWELLEALQQKGAGGLFHLSTNMCPTHRRDVLDEVRRRLVCQEPCRLVSTQCVEAGVDLDFPMVFRALGPLDAVAQAAGRCNRNGRRETGWVHVFRPEDEGYPDATYGQAASVTSLLLNKAGTDGLDITDPAVFAEYYRELYDIARPESKHPDLIEAIKTQHFANVAQEYRLIRQDAVNVLVPYNLYIHERLADEVRRTGLTRRWIERARPFSIGLFRPRPDAPAWSCLEPAPIGRGRSAEDWFIYLREEHYDRKLKGLVLPAAHELLIG